MMKFREALLPGLATLLLLALATGTMGCKNNDQPLAPYNPGTITLTPLSVQASYDPRITWNGSYVSAVGVNRGSRAIIDTSLVWLIHQAGNALHYPQTFGTIPSGAEDLTVSSGGQATSALSEDVVYSFWIAREDVWGTIAANHGKVLAADSTLSTGSRVSGDTLYLSAASFAAKVNPIDIYINIRNVRPVGRLGVINVIQTNTSNAPIITFTITQTGTLPPDTLLANMGIASGAQYDVSSVAWEVLAVDSSSGTPVYWSKDVIGSPVTAGQKIPGTVEFTAFPSTGLQRNVSYYVWIANKNWDQRNRTRSAYNYASATFETY